MHLLYALIAVMLVGLFSMHMLRGIRDVQTDMWQNEVLTQVTGVGLDVLEHIVRQPFDESTDESKQDPLIYPVINSPVMLTAEAFFGGCGNSLDYVNPACDDIDDFDGTEINAEVEGLPYTITVNVQYVNPNAPATSTGGVKSLAKEVELTITTPLLQAGGQPIQMTMSRVATYNRHLQAPL